MTPHLVRADDVPPQAWRNGGGTTRELLCWPSTLDCAVRVSLADITREGPFSAFPGVERWFTVIAGAGVVLHFRDGERAVYAGDAPLCFDGAAAPGCRLVGGPTRDLNLMLRGGRGLMCPAEPGVGWEAPFRWRGLFSAGTGRWFSEGEKRRLAPNSLLWSDTASGKVWTFEPDERGTRAWWLGCTRGVKP